GGFRALRWQAPAGGLPLGDNPAVLRQALRRAMRPQHEVLAPPVRGANGDPRLSVVGLLGVGGWDVARWTRHRQTLSAEGFRTIGVSTPRHPTQMGTL